MNILDIEVPMITALNGPVLLHSEYALLTDIILATPETVFQDKPHFDFGIVPGDGVEPALAGGDRQHSRPLFHPHPAGARRARRPRIGAWSTRSCRPSQLLARAHEIAEGIAGLPPLTSRYTRIALTQKLRRIIDEGAGYGLALEGISAAEVARVHGRQWLITISPHIRPSNAAKAIGSNSMTPAIQARRLQGRFRSRQAAL